MLRVLVKSIDYLCLECLQRGDAVPLFHRVGRLDALACGPPGALRPELGGVEGVEHSPPRADSAPCRRSSYRGLPAPAALAAAAAPDEARLEAAADTSDMSALRQSCRASARRTIEWYADCS